ncbi:MAG: hypothetical protein ABSA54_05970 [Terriglobales bacterium]|jgi:hypothetical protein
MTYFKSAIAGLAAVFLAAAVVYIVALLAIAVIFRSGGIDLPIWHVHTESPAFWLLVAVVFALGFFWEFKRLSN